MKIKRLLRFYFCADSLDEAIDRLIMHAACRADADVGSAEKICELIDEKITLNGLWSYLNGVIEKISGEEREAAEKYAHLRSGIKNIDSGEAKVIGRSIAKIARRIKLLDRYGDGVKLLNKYYCLLR